jgi:hypothetical protein
MSKALKEAMEANEVEAVAKAVKSVRDINRKLRDGPAPLLYACAIGAAKVLEVLFAAGAVGERRNTFPGDTPFAVAAEHKQFEVMKRLLDLRQASDEAVRFVLENACMKGDVELIKFLLDEVKPSVTIELFRLDLFPRMHQLCLNCWWNTGGDLSGTHETNDAKMMTPLHDLWLRVRAEWEDHLRGYGASAFDGVAFVDR